MNTFRISPSSGPRTPLRCTNQLTHDQAHRILAAHTRDQTENRCQACGFTYCEDKPNCMAVVRALRWLAEHPEGTQRSLTKTPYDVLYRLAREHHPNSAGTRCARCGLVYGIGSRECPTLRGVRRELACRGDLRDPHAETGRALCAGSNKWQVDTHSDHRDWQRAVTLCRRCPVLATCRRTVDDAISTGDVPKSLIVGAMLFDSRGHIVPEDTFVMFDRRRNGVARRTRVRQSKHRNVGAA